SAPSPSAPAHGSRSSPRRPRPSPPQPSRRGARAATAKAAAAVQAAAIQAAAIQAAAVAIPATRLLPTKPLLLSGSLAWVDQGGPLDGGGAGAEPHESALRVDRLHAATVPGGPHHGLPRGLVQLQRAPRQLVPNAHLSNAYGRPPAPLPRCGSSRS